MLESKIQHLKDNSLYRCSPVIESRNKSKISINGKELVNFTSNDYLGISDDDEVKQALLEGISVYGLGSTSSPSISGYYKCHNMLENQFAKYLGYEAAVLFNSGYHANTSVIQAIRNDEKIILDKYCHASIIDGVRLSGGRFATYKHNDIQSLSKVICDNSIVITESVFSMQGAITPINDIVKVIKQCKNVRLIVDDAHGIGVIGKNGKGVLDHFNLNANDVDILIVPLGKSFGSSGAMVLGNQTVIENIRQFARSYRYSTYIPPLIAHALIKVLNIITTQKWRSNKLLDIIYYFNNMANQLGLSMLSDHLTAIKVIPVNCNFKVIELRKKLLDLGFLVTAIRPPTVPVGKSCIRISLNIHHIKKDILKLLKSILVNL